MIFKLLRTSMLAALLIFVLLSGGASAQVPLPTSAPGSLNDNYVRAPRLGITFVNSGEHPISEQRYSQALFLGAGWTRWPLYWDKVETSNGNYDWGVYDQLVNADLSHGLQSNVILLGRPGFHQDGGSIAGLRSPIFNDGSDMPAPGKTVNLNNEWAAFVYEAVMRYKPGGWLAQAMGWPQGAGVTVWEAWNEPDLRLFWAGNTQDYARLLKVTYIVAHYADPQARVMFGGLAYGNPDLDDWLARALAIFAQDPQREQFNWYMDIVAVHSYSYARRSGVVVTRAKENLAKYGLSRPIWLNENGVPVWDDYPGPTWATNDPSARVLRATQQQQAAYVIQSAAFAWAAGADVVIFHQLYDDCGNQQSGTDFPPNNGDLCTGGVACWGDAHGLFRNPNGAACFSQHPLAGSPRPAAAAYRLMAQIFGAAPFEAGQLQVVDGKGMVVTFARPRTGERIHIVWNRSLDAIAVDLPASSQTAELYTLGGEIFTVEPSEDIYKVSLPPATRDNLPSLQAGDAAGIGGPPYILVEKSNNVNGSFNPALPQLAIPLGTPIPTTAATLIPPAPTLRPTIDPAQDTHAPITFITPLPVISPTIFDVSWSAEDDSGIANYLVWVRVNAGDWQPWLETELTQGQYTGESGKTYEFAVWAVDLAGNWSLNTELQPQAITAVR
jgi:hypothetical protein